MTECVKYKFMTSHLWNDCHILICHKIHAVFVYLYWYMSQRSKLNICLTPCVIIFCCVAHCQMVLFWSGIIFSNGENWKEMRRLLSATCGTLGWARRKWREIIEEIEYLKGELISLKVWAETHGIMLLVYKIHWVTVVVSTSQGNPWHDTACELRCVKYHLIYRVRQQIWIHRPSIHCNGWQSKWKCSCWWINIYDGEDINKWTKTVFCPQILQNLLFTYKAPIMKVHFRLNQSLLCPFLALQHISMVKSIPEKQKDCYRQYYPK